MGIDGICLVHIIATDMLRDPGTLRRHSCKLAPDLIITAEIVPKITGPARHVPSAAPKYSVTAGAAKKQTHRHPHPENNPTSLQQSDTP